LGYEVRYDTQRFLQQQEHGKELPRKKEANSSTDGVPTAALFLARQSMVYHHPTQQWYLIGLVETENDSDNILEWMQSTCKRMLQLEEKELKTRNDMPASPSTTVEASATPPLAFVPNRPKETYEKNIDACHEYIRMGESYELCLTNQLEAKVPDSLSTLDLYRILRKRNPAPYAGYFRWNTDASESATTRPTSSSVTICCSSPERFMSIKRRQDHPEMPTILEAEAKPIKGTEARVLASNGVCRNDAESREDERRARSLELSLKNRAENLMIVDLLRNDLSRVCRVGSVHVAKLMGIESFATVHQMVSTIRGTLSDTATSIDLLRASFPGGSMTGAPKIRTMELLEDLEENVDRGPYAGSLGYLSVNGCMDMNIIIRSAIVTPTTDGSQKISIGAGGAITALSETQDEYDEMLLKARALVESAQEWAKSGNARTPALAPIEESDSSTLMETKSITTGQI
jgi:para-aminobenzoate synthetase